MAQDLQHAMNIHGACVEIPRWMAFLFYLHRGRAVTVVDWRGCMAETRHVVGTGRVVRVANQREKYGDDSDSIECLVVRMDETGEENWQPIGRVRFVGTKREVEVWT